MVLGGLLAQFSPRGVLDEIQRAPGQVGLIEGFWPTRGSRQQAAEVKLDFSRPTFHVERGIRERVAFVLAFGLVVAGSTWTGLRGGALGWIVASAGGALIFKFLIFPSRFDGLLSVGSMLVAIGLPFGTFESIRSAWESGEVVTLEIPTAEGPHTARVWVLDDAGVPTVIYDAKQAIAEVISAGKTLIVTRGGKSRAMTPVATAMDEMEESEVARIFDLMEVQYGELNRATELFYSMLGRERGRVVLIIRLQPVERVFEAHEATPIE